MRRALHLSYTGTLPSISQGFFGLFLVGADLDVLFKIVAGIRPYCVYCQFPLHAFFRVKTSPTFLHFLGLSYKKRGSVLVVAVKAFSFYSVVILYFLLFWWWQVFCISTSSYVDARLYVDHESRLYSVANEDERPCSQHCPCLPLQERAKADPYVFSLATNPFYLWLICTIFTEAGEEFVPKTLTQLYTWVILVFAHR